NSRIRKDYSDTMGRHFRLEHARTISCIPGRFEMASSAAGENHQHGFTGRPTSLGQPRALLFVQSCGAYAHQSDGEGFGAGDRGELRGTRYDRSGGESRRRVYETYGKADSDAT